MIIDAHVHVYPDSIAPQVIAKFETHCGFKLPSDGTLDGMIRSMQRSGITHCVVVPVSTKPEQVAGINRFALSLRRPGIIPFGTLYPQAGSWRNELGRLKEEGVTGIKFHPDYQSFYVDDPALFPFFEAIAAAGLTVLFHAGKNINLPDPCHCTPARLKSLLDHVPGLKVIAAHLGGWKLWDEVERVLMGQRIWMDVSFVPGFISDDQLLRIVNAHDPDKILFGSDYPWTDPHQALLDFTKLPLPANRKQAILSDNARALFNLSADDPGIRP